jgi:hypothetical protein
MVILSDITVTILAAGVRSDLRAKQLRLTPTQSLTKSQTPVIGKLLCWQFSSLVQRILDVFSEYRAGAFTACRQVNGSRPSKVYSAFAAT